MPTSVWVLTTSGVPHEALGLLTPTHHSHPVVSSSVLSGHLLTESLHPVLCLPHPGAFRTHYRVSQHLPVSFKRRLGLAEKVHNKLTTWEGGDGLLWDLYEFCF